MLKMFGATNKSRDAKPTNDIVPMCSFTYGSRSRKRFLCILSVNDVSSIGIMDNDWQAPLVSKYDSHLISYFASHVPLVPE